MCYTSSVVPGPVGADETIERLMLANALDQGVSRGFVVAALDVEVTEERLKDERCDDGNPCLKKGDECGVGAELFQDVDRQLALEVPRYLRAAVGKDDHSPTVIHGAIIMGNPFGRTFLSGTKSSFSGVRVDDGEAMTHR